MYHARVLPPPTMAALKYVLYYLYPIAIAHRVSAFDVERRVFQSGYESASCTQAHAAHLYNDTRTFFQRLLYSKPALNDSDTFDEIMSTCQSQPRPQTQEQHPKLNGIAKVRGVYVNNTHANNNNNAALNKDSHRMLFFAHPGDPVMGVVLCLRVMVYSDAISTSAIQPQSQPQPQPQPQPQTLPQHLRATYPSNKPQFYAWSAFMTVSNDLFVEALYVPARPTKCMASMLNFACKLECNAVFICILKSQLQEQNQRHVPRLFAKLGFELVDPTAITKSLTWNTRMKNHLLFAMQLK